jgi:hypothetical protein
MALPDFCSAMVKWKLIVSVQDGLAAISIYCTIYCFRVQLKKIIVSMSVSSLITAKVNSLA